ncbi:MAG: AraD1 family protein [Bryobacteraceae bacterium]
MTRLIQLSHPAQGRRVALVDGNDLRLLTGFTSVYQIATSGKPLIETARKAVSSDTLSYDDVYAGESEWKILPAFDHPEEPARCLVSGTGLTHRASADNRQAMHADVATVTDSMRMYQWGVEGGRPAEGEIGVPPEWFYKGPGSILRGHGDPLTIPPYGEDGGEEPEIAGAYIIDAEGAPRRVGMVMGNEFSDHKVEKKNYLYLAVSKLRQCAIGPEIALDPDFSAVPGQVKVERNGTVLWEKGIASGEAKMSHTLANLEHHHFKFEAHRRPGDAHIHFFGADAFSFGAGIALEEGDVMVVEFPGFGRALRNPLGIDKAPNAFVRVTSL